MFKHRKQAKTADKTKPEKPGSHPVTLAPSCESIERYNRKHYSEDHCKSSARGRPFTFDEGNCEYSSCYVFGNIGQIVCPDAGCMDSYSTWECPSALECTEARASADHNENDSLALLSSPQAPQVVDESVNYSGAIIGSSIAVLGAAAALYAFRRCAKKDNDFERQ